MNLLFGEKMEYITLKLKNGEELKIIKISKTEVEVQLITTDHKKTQSVKMNATIIADIIFN